MIVLDRPLIVEGRYDKSRLAALVDGAIFTTDGFRIFSDRRKLQMLRQLAKEKGVILLTDSDAAGFRIRNFLKSTLGCDRVTHVYIPDIYGKERRKDRPSAEGKLGVEGMDTQTLMEAFRLAGVLSDALPQQGPKITKADLYALGLSGTPDSAIKRRQLAIQLGLPERMGVNSLLDYLNTRFTLPQLQEQLACCGFREEGKAPEGDPKT